MKDEFLFWVSGVKKVRRVARFLIYFFLSKGGNGIDLGKGSFKGVL